MGAGRMALHRLAACHHGLGGKEGFQYTFVGEITVGVPSVAWVYRHINWRFAGNPIDRR